MPSTVAQTFLVVLRGCDSQAAGFRQTHHVDLHALEAELEFTLKKLQKLLNSYLFHRAANLHQRPCLDKLMAAPPLGHVALLVDFKELLTLPLSKVQTSEMFYATGRFEVCTFGGVLVEHLPESTEESPKVETSYILIFSSILDHTALRANQLIDVCLGQRKKHVPLSGIHPHCRRRPAFPKLRKPLPPLRDLAKHIQSSLLLSLGGGKAHEVGV